MRSLGSFWKIYFLLKKYFALSPQLSIILKKFIFAQKKIFLPNLLNYPHLGEKNDIFSPWKNWVLTLSFEINTPKKVFWLYLLSIFREKNKILRSLQKIYFCLKISFLALSHKLWSFRGKWKYFELTWIFWKN